MSEVLPEVVLVRVDPKEKEFLRQFAKEDDRSMSSMVRELIRCEAVRRLKGTMGSDDAV